MAWVGAPVFSFLGHLWSLAVEEHFYLVWPLLVWALPRRALVAVSAALVLGTLALRVALHAGGTGPFGIIMMTPCRIDGLALGALLAALHRTEGGLPRFVRPARSTWLGTGALLIGLIVARGGLSVVDPVVNTLGFTLVDVFFGALLLLTAGSRAGSPLQSLFSASPMRFLGRYSYGLYVFHLPVAHVLFRVGVVDSLTRVLGSRPLAIVLEILLGFAITLPLALLSYHLFEKHFLRLKSLFNYRAPAGAAPLGDGMAPALANGDHR